MTHITITSSHEKKAAFDCLTWLHRTPSASGHGHRTHPVILRGFLELSKLDQTLLLGHLVVSPDTSDRCSGSMNNLYSNLSCGARSHTHLLSPIRSSTLILQTLIKAQWMSTQSLHHATMLPRHRSYASLVYRSHATHRARIACMLAR